MYRFASVLVLVGTVLLFPCGVAPATAQGLSPCPIAAIRLEAVPVPSPVVPPCGDANRESSKIAVRRPPALLPMYVSFASLQALDTYSTARALDRGGVEANPLMRGLAGSTAGMLAVKAAATTGIVYSVERMWRRNRMAAVVFMVTANSAMAYVVQHNYRTAY